MSKRRQEAAVHPDQRRKILEHVLANGAAWEMPTAELVCVISKKKKKFEQKRMGAKVVKAAERLLDSADILTGEAATTYRALSARLNYLASDRPDLAFSAKELCRDFAQPTAKSVERLKRAVRYLRHRPRLIWLYKWQEPVKHLVAFCDTDFAGCVQTRRSTSGGALMRGGHLIRHWSQTQTTVALSSAEAELGGICRGSSHGIGLRSICHDLGFDWSLEVRSDAAAAIGICRRRGLGKVRHLAVADLWVQDHVRTKDFLLTKVPGAENPADIMTKWVDQACLNKHLLGMSLLEEKGRAASAPALDQ